MAHPAQAGAVSGTDEDFQNLGSRSIAPVPPRTPHEEAMLAIWREILDRPDIGVLDDFFDLDGNSLHAIQVIARIREKYGVSIRASDFFESPTVAALAAAIAAQSPSDRPTISRRPPDAEPVLSFFQQRLWLEDQIIRSTAFNIHGRRRLIGRLDVPALEASIRTVMKRHEALRSRFPDVDGEPLQVVDELDEDWRLRIVHVADGEDDRLGAAQRLADGEAEEPFDLAQGPLFRCLLIRLGDTDHVLSITAHHIICDNWSVGLFLRELSALYRAGGDVDRADLPALPIQYRDFSVWQHRSLTGDALERQLSYWRDHLAGAPPALTLPTAERHSPSAAVGGGLIRSALSADDTAALHNLCRAYDATTFMALLAGFAAVLGRSSGQRDVVIGVPINGRTDTATQNLIGLFFNILPIRLDLSGDPTFGELLKRAREAAVNGYAHADVPFDLLVRELQVARVTGRPPLFQVGLNLVERPKAGEPLGDLSDEPMDGSVPPPSKLDFLLNAWEMDGVLQMELEFDTEHYEQSQARALLDEVVTLLRAAMSDSMTAALDAPAAG